MIYRVEEHDEAPDDRRGPYRLVGTSCTEVTGSAVEWLLIAAAIKERRNVGFRLAAVRYDYPLCVYHVFNPRNRCGSDDYDTVLQEDGLVLAEQIVQFFEKRKRARQLPDFDPCI